MQPECIALLKYELGSTIAAPSAVPAGVSLVARLGTAGIVLLWDQPLTDYAQATAKERYCTANPADSEVCASWKIRGIVYTAPNYPNCPYTYHEMAVSVPAGITPHLEPYETHGNYPWFCTNALLAKIPEIGFFDTIGQWKSFQGFDNVNLNKPWYDWPQQKRDTAVGLLTNPDWQKLIDSMGDDGLRLQNEPINGPKIVIEGQQTDDLNTPEDERQSKTVNGPFPYYWNQGPNVPYTFPDPLNQQLNQQLTEKQKNRLKDRLKIGNLTDDDISRGKFRAIPEDPNNRKCFYTELTTHLGNYEPHTRYATQVTGSLGDLFMTTPTGEFTTYDGAVKVNGTAVNYQETEGAVAEVKTDQGWLIKVVNGIPLSSYEQGEWKDLKLQLKYQAKVARVCKLRYFIAFARQDVANIAGPMLVNMLFPDYPEIRVRYIPFN